MKTIEDRLAEVERVAHEPVDLSALVQLRAEAVAQIVERDPHTHSSRPCGTCDAVSAVLGRPFGCIARARRTRRAGG